MKLILILYIHFIVQHLQVLKLYGINILYTIKCKTIIETIFIDI